MTTNLTMNLIRVIIMVELEMNLILAELMVNLKVNLKMLLILVNLRNLKENTESPMNYLRI